MLCRSNRDVSGWCAEGFISVAMRIFIDLCGVRVDLFGDTLTFCNSSIYYQQLELLHLVLIIEENNFFVMLVFPHIVLRFTVNFIRIFEFMIGPHYERLAEIEQKMTAKQMLERVKARPDNPLSKIVDKLKRQFSEYETAYSDPIMDYQISSLDRILSFDSKLGPILDALEKQNQMLRKELGILEGQLSNTVGICEQILSQNNELKLIIKRKNEDIAKIIDSIAHNQAEGMDEIQEKNRLLLEQNSILIRHLEDIKKQHENYQSIFDEKDEQRSNQSRKFQQLKKQLTQSITRQRDLSRKISMLQQNLYQQSQQLYQLQSLKQNLTYENNDLKNQINLAQNQSGSIGNQTLRRQVENQFEPILQEHKILKRQRTQFLKEAEKAKLERQKLEDLAGELERRLNKLEGDLDLTNSLLVEKRNENTYLTSTQIKLQAKLAEIKQENNRFKAERETSSTYALAREKRLLQEIDELRKALQGKQAEIQRRMRQIKDSMHGLLQAKDLQVRQLRDENLQLQKRAFN